LFLGFREQEKELAVRAPIRTRRFLTFSLTASMVAMPLQSCRPAERGPDVTFIDRAITAGDDDPLALIVSVHSDGRLALNQIQTGTIGDPDLLNQRLKTIFEDRRRSSVYYNEVHIETVGTVNFEDVDRLIRSIKAVHPTRIGIITKEVNRRLEKE
jgi:biopolymer transport protein ExbD